MGVCDHKCVILLIERARCTLHKEILDLLNEKGVLEHKILELVYKSDKKSTVSV